MHHEDKKVLFWMLLALALGFCLGLELFGYELEVHFTPGSDPVVRIVDRISKARKTIKVQAYHFTDERIAAALIERQKHGVQVAIIMDRTGAASQYTVARLCKEGGCQVRVDPEHQIAHNKIIVIDSGTQWAVSISGSYNWTEGANKRNAENVFIVAPPYKGNESEIIEAYAANWMLHWEHTTNYIPKPFKAQIVKKPKPVKPAKTKPEPKPKNIGLTDKTGNSIPK